MNPSRSFTVNQMWGENNKRIFTDLFSVRIPHHYLKLLNLAGLAGSADFNYLIFIFALLSGCVHICAPFEGFIYLISQKQNIFKCQLAAELSLLC